MPCDETFCLAGHLLRIYGRIANGKVASRSKVQATTGEEHNRDDIGVVVHTANV
jgi:hypothetical protein